MHRYLFFSAVILVFSDFALGWGERGHDIVTQVAVERLAEERVSSTELITPFRQRTHMLAHLSNVPDTVWRADYISESQRALNGPTHYVDLDYVYTNPEVLDQIDFSYLSVRARAKENGFDLASDVGTAPWRILQLYREMTEAFTLAAEAETRAETITQVDQALLYGGLMSHFVGDLANPHHTTKDHDGWMTGNGGLHVYFESNVVAALPLSLITDVAEYSSEGVLEQRLRLIYDEQQIVEILADPEKLIFSLVLDSFQSLGRLVELDNRYSLISKSIDHSSTSGIRRRAERKPANSVASHYESFATERLAMGSSVLAQLWLLAWQEAGQPDLSDYRSYWYPVQPDFIQPDYIQ